jgi:hypothetical protein
MTDHERMQLSSTWTAGVVFVCALFLGSGLIKAFLVAVFVLGSCLLNLGQRWLLRGGFAMALLSIAVAMGAPHPRDWPEVARTAPDFFLSARLHLPSQGQ